MNDTDHRNPHGGEVLRLAREHGLAPDRLLDFSSNADSLVDHITERLIAQADAAHRHYPDDHCTHLRTRIAVHEGLPPDRILAGNGSSELIFLALSSLPVHSAVIVAPVFSEYDRACRAFDIAAEHLVLSPDNDFRFTPADLQRLAGLSAAADITILCQPTNPTGALHDIAQLLDACASPFVLVDNTYREFLHGTNAYAANCLHRYQRHARPGTMLLSLCSFTKYFHCTGIRLGYIAAPEHAQPDPIAILSRRQPPWSVWHMAQSLGVAFLEHLDEYRAARRGFPGLRQTMARDLTATGLFSRIFPANANFLTAQLATPSHATELPRFLLARDIVVRRCDDIPHMPPGCLRMQVRTPEENHCLITTLRDFAAKWGGREKNRG